MDWFDLIRFALVVIAKYQVWRRASNLGSVCWSEATANVSGYARTRQ